MSPLRLAFTTTIEAEDGALIIAPGGEPGARRVRLLAGSALPVAALLYPVVADVPMSATFLFASLCYWLLYVVLDRYRLKLEATDGVILVELQPLVLSWMSVRRIELEGVTDVREHRGGVEIHRDEKWTRVWLTYPPFPARSAKTTHGKIAEFVRSNRVEMTEPTDIQPL